MDQVGIVVVVSSAAAVAIVGAIVAYLRWRAGRRDPETSVTPEDK